MEEPGSLLAPARRCWPDRKRLLGLRLPGRRVHP